MAFRLFFKIFILILCVFVTWYKFDAISSSPFLALTFGTIFISLYFLLIDFKQFSLKKFKKNFYENKESSLDLFLNHPAKMLVMYFIFISFIGTILLSFPFSHYDKVSPIDAFFTAVSAACVTGLTTINIGEHFSFLGQIIILILIQLGGLGIMVLASIVLYNIGKISLKHERIITSDLTDDLGEVKKALICIGEVTFIAEFIGALLLTLAFYLNGENVSVSIFKGIFTSISAFCNAGFSLEQNSLEAFKNSPLILYTVSTLIILGSLSPATCLLLPKFFQGKKIKVQSQISIVTTLSLLIFGTFCFLFFEWNNILSDLSISEKFNNAWFMSAATRTGGFSSIDILKMKDSLYIIILIFMFIGGTPGGIAGGVKTTTFAVLILTFFATVRNKRNIIIGEREIRKEAVYKAITIFMLFLTFALFVFFMLLATQPQNTKVLLFETISALGTTGLSLNVTPNLDEIGKVIIIFTMFVGRVGPLTLLMTLGGKRELEKSSYPPVKISLN